jgi:transcriptional regulator with XRE-family HTH domain
MTTNYSPGIQLKRIRKERGISLREIARQTDLTASFLSQVEHGISNVSLDSLVRIAEALEVPLMYFLEELPSEIDDLKAHIDPEPCEDIDRSNSYSPVVRAGCRPRLILPPSGIEYQLLTPDLSHKLEAVIGRLSPGSSNVARRLRAETEEFMYVLSGELLIGLGDIEYVLRAGDSINFMGEKLTKLACASVDREATWISVITPPVF